MIALPLGITILVVLFDQVTKYLVRGHFVLHEAVTVIPGLFDLCYIRNTGAAWGILPDATIWLALLSVAMLAVIVIFRKSLMAGGGLETVGLGLICGGIIGNLIDRVWLKYVVDFLDFYWRDHHFPAFNVADSAICVGVFIYVVAQFFRPQAVGDVA